jgi:hypothetical protein
MTCIGHSFVTYFSTSELEEYVFIHVGGPQKKQKCFFFKNGKQKVKQVMSGGWYQWEGGEYKQRVKEDEGSENIMY